MFLTRSNIDQFTNEKKRIQNASDLSRKGNLDEDIRNLITYINNLDEYYTTSSCSGRIIVLGKDGNDSCKKGCKWVVTSHSAIDPEQILQEIKCGEKNMFLKFEPFILHVRCKHFIAMKKMQDCALSAGFRNSGSVFGRHGSITFAVRGTHGLEVPLSDDQGLIVSDDYVRYIVDQANCKMSENVKKIESFTQEIYKRLSDETLS